MAHQFGDIYEAPESLRHIGYIPITVKQLNALLVRAEQLGAKGKPDIGRAKQEFREKNEVVDGQWVPVKAQPKGAS
jgi:hypothetical protein